MGTFEFDDKLKFVFCPFKCNISYHFQGILWLLPTQAQSRTLKGVFMKKETLNPG